MRVMLALVTLLVSVASAGAEPLCETVRQEGSAFTVCRIDPAMARLRLYWGTENGAALGSLDALAAERKAHGERLVLGMNAGMYGPDLKPVGLYVENGQQLKAANTVDGEGNFHLKPNGVFYLANGRAGVAETQAYLRSGLKPDFATQSGPMLVLDGKLHPRFGAYGKSQKIRNGVGIGPGGIVMLAISQEPVTFPAFASLFRDALHCRNALYLDGSVSSLRLDAEAGGASLDQSGYRPLGPLIGVTAR